ncbi:class I SAM-dependent methyltransferase [Novosphingobium sp. 9U]|uniref:class I SAM-dependent methyltransferase n=1 Tax=Novosphingobium sp. 9U TaxID=2653158 RepID=UPI0012EF0112|nr:methyltransferase [Novosphingobium sp. 9U]VWX48716.1 Methyltransferase [Novosphingobium sp. 9U]
MRRVLLSLATGFGLLAAPVAVEAASDTRDTEACEGCKALLELAAANPKRTADRARDAARHPVESMAFFGVRPDMKVGEYAPGGEWYSRFLGLYLGKQGKLVGLFFNPDTPAFSDKMRTGIAASAAKYPQDVASFTGLPATRFSAMTLKDVPADQKGTFDRILIPRMLHNMLQWNNADSELKAMRALLKPDGMIGVEQHRAKADAPFAYADGSKGYLRQADVIRLMELNGFELVRKSEINANPKDSASWPDGVWTLPPTFALKDQDKAKYQAIGESDRMTLLFRKRP